jgi:hypothetical protein
MRRSASIICSSTAISSSAAWRAASRAASPSSSERTTYSSASWLWSSEATIRLRPSRASSDCVSSRCSASRMGVRDTPKRSASSDSTSRSPGL